MATNEFGFDHRYFESKLQRILQSIERYTPDEFARECLQMAQTAKPLSGESVCYKATTDKRKLSGCEHEDGSGWCTAGNGVVCEDANRCPDGSIGCNMAL